MLNTVGTTIGTSTLLLVPRGILTFSSAGQDQKNKTQYLSTARERDYTRTRKIISRQEVQDDKMECRQEEIFYCHIHSKIHSINNPSGQLDTRLDRRTWTNWMAKADKSGIPVGVGVKGSNNSESDLQMTFHVANSDKKKSSALINAL